jgi:antitoxin VapB
MSLNIKNERTHALVRELAILRGVSQTEAVEEAVRARLAALRAEHDTEARFQRIMAIARQTGPGLRASTFSVDDLYDEETGLPR